MGLALLPVVGPWQPASVITGWMAAALVVWGTVAGRAWAVSTASVLLVVRVGVHGVAGGGLGELVTAALFLYLVIEGASASFEARQMPTRWDRELSRVLLVAGGAAAVVGLLALAIAGVSAGGRVSQIVGLGLAFAVGTLLLWIQRRVRAGG